jgi:hypothetical protein
VEPRLLWSDVLLCARNCFHNDFFGAESEVSNFDNGHCFANNVFGFQENVFGFEVAVSDSVVVQLLHSLTDLIYDFESVLLIHFIVNTPIECVPASDGSLPQ